MKQKVSFVKPLYMGRRRHRCCAFPRFITTDSWGVRFQRQEEEDIDYTVRDAVSSHIVRVHLPLG